MHSLEHNEEYYTVHGKDVYSIQSILVSLNIPQTDTVYAACANDVVRWAFTSSFFFETASNAPLENGAEAVPLSDKDAAAVAAINAEIKNYKDAGTTIANQERIKTLRVQKKALLDNAKSASGAKNVLLYKKVLSLLDSRMVAEKLPQFGSVRWPFKEQMPYFTAGLEEFAAAVSRGEKTAITGGPCFFSEHEVDMILTFQDGSRNVYDFTTGRLSSPDEDGKSDEKLTRQEASLAVDVSFKTEKKQLTAEEYDSILYLFELAQATGSCLTVPIVDASYEKYITAMFASLPESVQRLAHERFREIAHPIIALYRELFDFFKSRYPSVQCVMMTGEDAELLELYYKKREPFVEKPSVKRGISSIPEKFESVKDYITLPALPFYLLGVQHVLEVDYLGEADSFIKCRRMHKGEMQLSALLYPIKMSADGWRNVFQTELQYKEFIERSAYGTR
ncbi:MAG: hypothetical protein K6G80_02485 [Treponema sp.]|nr:hypothetical protein [Treponema sp.]